MTAEELIKKRRSAIYRKRWKERHPEKYKAYMRNYMREYNKRKREQNIFARLVDLFRKLWR